MNKENGSESENQGVRRIQVSGNSTYLITLPKKWVEKVKLKSSDSVALLPLSNGTLLINPINLVDSRLPKSEEEQPSRTISIQSQKFEVIWRKFISAYLAGFNIVTFRSKKTLTKSDRMVIKRICHSVLGAEIVDESANSVTVRDLLGKGGFSIVHGIQRMHVISRSMLNDALESLMTGESDLIEDVVARDEEINKFHWMVCKQYGFLSKDVHFADRMAITPQEALGYLLVSRAIEKIADHASRIAQNCRNVKGDEPLVKEIHELGSEIVRLFDDSVGSLGGTDFDMIDHHILTAIGLQERSKELNKRVLSRASESPNSVSLAFVLDSLERVRSYSEDICEVSINHMFVSQLNKVSRGGAGDGN